MEAILPLIASYGLLAIKYILTYLVGILAVSIGIYPIVYSVVAAYFAAKFSVQKEQSTQLTKHN